MNSFWGLIPRYLWKNKKRVFSIGSAITLSIFLIMSLFIMKEERVKLFNEECSNLNGTFGDIGANIQGMDNIEALRQDDRIKEMTVSTFKFGTSRVQGTDYYFWINSYDNNADSLMDMDFIEGRKPEQDDEIALESWVMPYLDKAYQIGDTIELTCNIYPSPDRELNMNYKFKLSGIFDYSAEGFIDKNAAMAWVTESFAENQIKKNGFENVEGYRAFIYLNNNRDIQKSVTDFNNDERYPNIVFLKIYAKQVALQKKNKLDMASAVLFVVLGVVVAINIYNVFSVSMEERRKDFGILKALGCTKIKLKLMGFIEGFIIGTVSIILGVISGNVVTKAVVVVLGYETMDSIFEFPLKGVIFSFLIGYFSVFLGTYFPSRRISFISPVEAICRGGERYSHTRTRKGLMDNRRTFIFSMTLLNVKSNKKGFWTSAVSIGITIVLIMCTIYLMAQVNPLGAFRKQYGSGDFKISTVNYFTDDDLRKIEEVKGIDIISREKYQMVTVYPEENQITRAGYDYVKSNVKGNDTAERNFKNGVYLLNMELHAYDSEELHKLDKYIIAGDTEYSDEGYPKIYIVQGLNNYKYTDIKVGDKVEARYSMMDDKGNIMGVMSGVFKVGAVLKAEAVSGRDATVSLAGIINEEDAAKYLGLKGYSILRINKDDGFSYEEAANNLRSTVNGIRKAELSVYKEEYAKQKKENIKLSFILYTFAFSVGAISLINLINIMKMKILMMQQEVGLLRAIGFGIDEVKKMIMTEGAVYGIAAGIIGTGFGTLLTYIISRTVWYLNWTLPVMQIVVIFSGTIVITTVTSLISSRELFKTSIVDSIRSIE